jgi:KipI family sensor histidine kinase inhibitor
MPESGVPSVRPVGDGALLLELGEVSPAITAQARQLAVTIRAAAWPGVYDVVPAYRTVLLRFDPCLADGEALERALLESAAGTAGEPEVAGKVVEFPVCYGGLHGPDLDDVAAHTGLAREEVVRLHAEATYRVEFLGFSPGFPYLSGLPAALVTPRLATPRLRVPEGSVGIAGPQTGFYPLASPGGWRLIGRIPALRFDPTRPETLPYAPGDTIRFRPIDEARFAALERMAPPPAVPAIRAEPTCGLRVIEAGVGASVQDRGRFGLAALGYATAGAMDADALELANRLVGNGTDAAALEIGHGGVFEAIGDLVVAVTGADLAPTLDGEPLPCLRAAAMRAGSRLRFGAARSGARCYLAVGGGIAVATVLGSRATDLLAGLGGLEGRALQPGDVLPAGPAADPTIGHALADTYTPRYPDQIEVRVIWGPQDEWFDQAARALFAASPFRATARGDRTGLRLAGQAIHPAQHRDLASEGGVPGAIQIPPDGNPIVLLADSRGVGGYPKIATVISADLPKVGQARPGTTIHFHPITTIEARRLAQERQGALAALQISPVPELAVRCLLEGRQATCPRSLACLVSRRCLAAPPVTRASCT